MVLATIATPPAQAQFAPPAGGCPPGMHLEGFSCVYDRPVPQPTPPRTAPAQWNNFAAAVAWGDDGAAVEYVGIEKYFDPQAAREAVMEKCRSNGWMNCAVAAYVSNGAVAVGRNSEGGLHVKIGATVGEARTAVLAECKAGSVECEIVAAFDGTAEYF